MNKLNIIPVCQKCNSNKNDNDMEKWYKKQKFFVEHRLDKIKNYQKLMQETKDDIDPELILTKKVKKHMKGDSTLLMFWLKSRKPEIYNEWLKKNEMEKATREEERERELEERLQKMDDTGVIVLPEIEEVMSPDDEKIFMEDEDVEDETS